MQHRARRSFRAAQAAIIFLVGLVTTTCLSWAPGPVAGAATAPAVPGVEVPVYGDTMPDGGGAWSTYDATQTQATVEYSSTITSGPAATFIVNYDAGFGANPSAQAAFQAAVDKWAALISSSVPIVVTAKFGTTSCGGNPFGGSVLGSAGPSNFAFNFSGAPQADVFYPMAMANAIAGSDLDVGKADICAAFNAGNPNFYFGTDGNVPGALFDFESVVLHELGHGLGFVGSMRVNPSDSTQADCCFSNLPFVYDTFATKGDGTPVLNDPHPSAQLLTTLTGGDVFFRGPNTIAATGVNGSRLFAPDPFQSGSTFSHLDETSYPCSGSPCTGLNSLMTPVIFNGEVEHDPGPAVLGMFQDMGYQLASPAIPPETGSFHPLDPVRVLDTRVPTGVPNAGKIGPHGIVRLGFDPLFVPADASAVVISLVATNGTAPSFLTVFPDDGSTTAPNTSNVNFGPFQTVNNLVSARLDPTTKKIAIHNLAGSVDMVADLLGWYDDGTGAAGVRYTPLDPVRVVDTRSGLGTGSVGKVGPDGVIRVGFSAFGVPATATAVAISVVSTNGTQGSFLTVYPDTGSNGPPSTSNVNFGPNQTVNNLVISKVGAANQKLALFNLLGQTDIVADLVGYYDPTPTAAPFTALTPSRVLDTRLGIGTSGSIGKIGPGGIVHLPFPTQQVPLTATAVIISLVSTNATSGSLFTVWPDDGSPAPTVSMVNFGPNQTVNNLVIAKVDPTTHRIQIQNLLGQSDMVADLLGYF